MHVLMALTCFVCGAEVMFVIGIRCRDDRRRRVDATLFGMFPAARIWKYLVVGSAVAAIVGAVLLVQSICSTSGRPMDNRLQTITNQGSY